MSSNIKIPEVTGVSDASIGKATGKQWEDWVSILDKENAHELSHKEIVALLATHIDNLWWCQKLAVSYEKQKGKRITGQTSDAGFQIGVSKTFDIDKDSLWDIITSEKGIAAWLGKTEESLSTSGNYTTKEGITGKVTVLNPGSHFRMSWQPANWKKNSTLQVRVIPKKNKTTLSFHQEKLPSSKARAEMKKYWMEKIKIINRLVEDSKPKES